MMPTPDDLERLKLETELLDDPATRAVLAAVFAELAYVREQLAQLWEAMPDADE